MPTSRGTVILVNRPGRFINVERRRVCRRCRRCPAPAADAATGRPGRVEPVEYLHFQDSYGVNRGWTRCAEEILGHKSLSFYKVLRLDITRSPC